METRTQYKWISMLLALLLMMNIIPMSVFAQDSRNPYTTGMENVVSDLDLIKIAGYSSGMTDADGGIMEIVVYNYANSYAYSINGKSGKLIAIPFRTVGSNATLSGTEINVKELLSDSTFTYGDMTSVAVSPDGAKLAVALQAEDYADIGLVALFECNADGTLTFKNTVEVGVQPDMVTFTPDGTRILTANEGEPREGYGGDATDPKGTVSIIDMQQDLVKTIGFDVFDEAEARAGLVADGIIIKKNTNPSVDFEPEYIACTDTTAYVSLQEANAIAVLDLESDTFTGVYSCGFEDYSKVAVDLDKGDEVYKPSTYSGVYGIRMPDGISLYTVDGIDYILTANEGDSREWGEYTNENEVKKNKQSPEGNIPKDTISGKVVYFDTTDYDGLNAGKDYLFGGRSFTMFKVTETGLEEVFDSANDFENKTNEYFPEYFNCSNDDLAVDDRSGKKGPEPETVVVGNVNGKVYAFVSLERIGGIMVYDITEPDCIGYVNYINSRDFSADVAADDSPEGLCFVSAENSPTGEALLIAACEVGGTVAVYELKSNHIHTYDNNCDTTCNGCIFTREITHVYNKLEKDVDKHWYICSVCGEQSPDGKEVHRGGIATCREQTICEVCSTSYGEPGAHGEIEIRNAKPASCDEEGYTGDKHCKVCGEKLETGTVIAKTGQNYEWIVDKEPDGTETNSPQTGDNSNMALWITILFISGMGIVATTIYGIKKRTN